MAWSRTWGLRVPGEARGGNDAGCIVDDEQRSMGPQSPCALRVRGGAGPGASLPLLRDDSHRVRRGASRPTPGATVSVSGPGGRTVAGMVTDVKGGFRVVPLTPGRGYRVRASFPGLATVEMSDIDIPPGAVASVSLTLVPESAVRERVRVVYHHDAVDSDVTTTETRFSAEFIDALPLLGRNYQDVLALVPGVTDIDGDGNPNIHGARDTDVVTLVDGVSTVDPLTGKMGQQLNIDSIQEIEVKTSGASAEFGRAQGGFVNIVTKSGGNEFAGDFKMFYRSDRLDGGGH